MFGFIGRKWRDLTYSEALKKILEEEDELVKEWYREFLKSTSLPPESSPPGVVGPSAVENFELRKIWAELCRLHKESRKIEAIKQLSEQDEEKLPQEDRKVLKQLRKKLEWKPLDLRKGEKRYLDNSGIDRIDTNPFLKSNFRMMEKHIDEITHDEVKFWLHLVQEKEKIEKQIKVLRKSILGLQEKAWTIIRKIDKSDFTYIQDYLDITGRSHRDSPQKEEFFRGEDGKRTVRQLLQERIKYLDEHLRFVDRAIHILNDIEKRLKETRPK